MGPSGGSAGEVSFCGGGPDGVVGWDGGEEGFTEGLRACEACREG